MYITFILANLLLIPLGWLAIKIATTALRTPRNLLYPIVLLCCIVGSFAINTTNFDVLVMLCLGILAYFMETNGIPVAPAILGMVLGDLLEKSFMTSMMKVNWNFLAFFERPLSCALGLAAVLVWLSPVVV